MGTRVLAGAGVGSAAATEAGADADRHLDAEELLSLCDDFTRSIDGIKYNVAVDQSVAHARMLRSACLSEFNNLELELKECQGKICSCQEKIDKAKEETVADDELKALKSKIEEMLQEERQLRQDFRAVCNELDKLEHQRVSIEETIAAKRMKEKAVRKAQKTLSMFVSVTKIMPNLDEQEKIAGYIIDKNKKVETFEFEKTASPLDICNKLWKM